MAEDSSNFALILAGGSGTRFWPMSRTDRPKQLLHLIGEGTMLQQALRRVLSFVPASHVYILTNEKQRAEVLQQVKDEVLPSHVVAEPVRRDTAPAMALGAALIAARDPRARMLVAPSDAYIPDDAAFAALAQDALALASREPALITLGIRPTWPCPSYGYIERGELLQDAALKHPCYRVVRFCEKPDATTAERYLSTGRFCWNAGIFAWSVSTFFEQLRRHVPALAHFAQELRAAPNPEDFIRTHFPELTPISIDFALMEKADVVLNFEASLEWDDVGSWVALSNHLPHRDEAGNASNSPLVSLDAGRNIAFSHPMKQVALLGVQDLIVVDTPDALLVARKVDADRIKQIVAQLPPHLT